MEITSPRILKLKGFLFAILGVMAAVLLLYPDFSWQSLVLLVIVIWAFCRAYYFCFYVMHHYVDPNFRYGGLWSLVQYLSRNRKA